MLPVVTGSRSSEFAYRRLYLIHVGVLIYSGLYLLPAVMADGLLAAAQRPVSFEAFWESHFFHTPWLLGWQVASWLLVLLRVRRAMSRPPLAGLDERDGRPPVLPLAPFLAARLVLGTVTETWRELWWVWGGTAAVFVLAALDLHRM